MFEILMMGNVWFWIAVAMAFGGLLRCMAGDDLAGAMWVTIISILILCMFGNLAVGFKWCIANPKLILPIGLSYFAMGLLWSIAKWYATLCQLRREYAAARKEFLIKNELDPSGAVPIGKKKAWRDFLAHNANRQDLVSFAAGRYNPAGKTEAIIAWIAYWPISLFWTLLDDPIRRFGAFIYRRFTGIYDSIYARVHGNFRDDFE